MHKHIFKVFLVNVFFKPCKNALNTRFSIFVWPLSFFDITFFFCHLFTPTVIHLFLNSLSHTRAHTHTHTHTHTRTHALLNFFFSIWSPNWSWRVISLSDFNLLPLSLSLSLPPLHTHTHLHRVSKFLCCLCYRSCWVCLTGQLCHRCWLFWNQGVR